MNVLVACEWSGECRDALRDLGHEAWSCDLEGVEVEGKWSNYHLYGDVRWFMFRMVPGKKESWDMMIAFPPCTHLAVSGARYFKEKKREQEGALLFIKHLMSAPIPKIALENPIGVISTRVRKPDQIIQPWMFGNPESKATCLWLKGLPLLRPTKVLRKPEGGRWKNQTPSGQNKLGPSPERARIRGRTYHGIALAMAEQWAGKKVEGWN